MPDGPQPSDLRRLLSADQLGVADIDQILAESKRLYEGGDVTRKSFSATLLMLQPSLRTRLGFAEAVRRLGGTAHIISSKREIGGGSESESLRDAIRVASGMTDLVIVRADEALGDHADTCEGPIVNGGDQLEHPTQALIDLFAIQQECGPWRDLTIGVCGDLGMRVARSLLKFLAKHPPGKLRLMAPNSRQGDAATLTACLRDQVEFVDGGAWGDLDVLYLCGLPEGRDTERLSPAEREPFSLNEVSIRNLNARTHVFSPMPVIDEIAASLRRDSRIAIYRQSDLGVSVRMAVLLNVLGRS